MIKCVVFDYVVKGIWVNVVGFGLMWILLMCEQVVKDFSYIDKLCGFILLECIVEFEEVVEVVVWFCILCVLYVVGYIMVVDGGVVF